jgi:hypothetical protein
LITSGPSRSGIVAAYVGLLSAIAGSRHYEWMLKHVPGCAEWGSTGTLASDNCRSALSPGHDGRLAARTPRILSIEFEPFPNGSAQLLSGLGNVL